MVAPGFELVVGQNPLDRLRRNLVDHAVMDQLAGQFDTIPLRQGPPDHVRTLASQFDHIQHQRRGKKPAAGRVVFCHTTHRYHGRQSAGPTCGHAAHAVLPAWPWRQRSSRRPRATWHAPVWRALQGSSVSGATPSRWPVCRHASQYGWPSGVPAYLYPQWMSGRRHATSATTLPIFPSLFNGDLYLGTSQPPEPKYRFTPNPGDPRNTPLT